MDIKNFIGNILGICSCFLCIFGTLLLSQRGLNVLVLAICFTSCISGAVAVVLNPPTENTFNIL